MSSVTKEIEELKEVIEASEKRMEDRLKKSHVSVAGSVSAFGSVFERKMNALFWKIMRWVGLPVLVFTVTATAAWVRLESRVEANEDRNAEGGRYTQEEHDTYDESHDEVHDVLNATIDDLKK